MGDVGKKVIFYSFVSRQPNFFTSFSPRLTEMLTAGGVNSSLSARSFMRFLGGLFDYDFTPLSANIYMIQNHVKPIGAFKS